MATGHSGRRLYAATGRGFARLISDQYIGRCQVCGRAWPRRIDGTLIAHAGQRWGPHAPNAIDNFCFDVTLGYRRLERPRRVTGG
jgi:hypothetical protein